MVKLVHIRLLTGERHVDPSPVLVLTHSQECMKKAYFLITSLVTTMCNLKLTVLAEYSNIMAESISKDSKNARTKQGLGLKETVVIHPVLLYTHPKYTNGLHECIQGSVPHLSVLDKKIQAPILIFYS